MIMMELKPFMKNIGSGKMKMIILGIGIGIIGTILTYISYKIISEHLRHHTLLEENISENSQELMEIEKRCNDYRDRIIAIERKLKI